MTFRPPTPQERALLDKLAAANFRGSSELKAQLESVQVRVVDDDGSLELVSSSGPDAIVSDSVPIDGESVDRDGVRVQILLHVENGRVKELEFYKVDGSKVQQIPDADGMTVLP
jgi:hypothetical protein